MSFDDDKFLPVHPRCSFRVEHLPCFVKWREKCGASLAILTKILKEMDSRQLCPRAEGRAPFSLLDSHGSRAEIELLKFSNDDVVLPSGRWMTQQSKMDTLVQHLLNPRTKGLP